MKNCLIIICLFLSAYVLGQYNYGSYNYGTYNYNDITLDLWKLNFTDQLLWKANFTGSGRNYPTKSIIDSLDNIYILGAFNDSCDIPSKIKTKGGFDAFIAKYDPNGNILWVKQIGGSGNDYALGIDISDDNEYIYVTGIFQNTVTADYLSLNSTGGFDGFLAKYKKNGDIVWIKNIASATVTLNSTQRPNGIKLDKNNHLVLAGPFNYEVQLGSNPLYRFTTSSSSSIGMFVAQFDTSGNILNAMKYESTGSGSNLYTFDVDTSGYYLSGFYKADLITDLGTKTSNAGSYDMYVYKVNYNLIGQWIIQVAGSGNDQLFSCSVDNKGYLYFGGHFASPTLTVDSNKYSIPSQRIATNTTSDGKTDVFFAKYKSDGTLQWFNNLGSTQNDYFYRTFYRNNYFIGAGNYGGTMSFKGDTITSLNTSDAFAIITASDNKYSALVPITGLSGNEIGETALIDSHNNFYIIGDYTSATINFTDGSTMTNSHSTTEDMFVVKYKAFKRVIINY
jgi:hypothetical protein